MGEPIPAEIMREAHAIATHQWLASIEKHALARAIASALMARDERAARIARQHDYWDEEWDRLDTDTAIGRCVTARSIAKSILTYDNSPALLRATQKEEQ